MKTCRTCKEEKPIDEFYKAKENADGRENRCRSCKNEANMKDKEGRRRRSYKYMLKKKYGLTLEDYDRMAEEQNHRCACCKRVWAEVADKSPFDRWVVDHNHDTGEVRGLLCNSCNAMLGQADDNVNRLACGIDYLLERGSYG